MKNTLVPDIESEAADALFGDPQALENLLRSRIADTIPASDMPVENESATPVATRLERPREKLVPARAESIIHRTIAALKKSFGVGRPQARRSTRFAFAGMERLEARALMSGVPAEIGMLQPSDLSWSEGKNDAAHVLGTADFLPGSNLYDVSMSPDGMKAVVGGQFAKASIVDTKTGREISTLAGHTSSVMSAAWAPDGTTFFTASYDKRVRHYTASGSLLWTSDDLGQLAVGVDVSPDGKSLLVRRHEMQPLVFDIATKAGKVLQAPSLLGDLDVLEDGTVLIVENDGSRYKGAKNGVHIVNAATGATEWTGSLSGMQATTAVATPNGAHVFSGTDDGTIVMHDRASGTSVSVAGPSSYVYDLAMDATGTFLVAATQGNLIVFDVEPLIAGTGPAVRTVLPLGSTSVTVSGSVALINNAFNGASSRTLAIDLSKVPNLQTRLEALTKQDEPKDDAPETRMETVTVSVKFPVEQVGQLAEGAELNVDNVGTVRVYRGGPTAIVVTKDGALQTGPNGGHFTANLPEKTFVENLTIRRASGEGKALVNLGDGYITVEEANKILTVGKEIPTISVVAYGTSVWEVTELGVTVTREVPVTDDDATDAVMAENALLSEIDTLSQPWSLDGEKNRVAALTKRAAALREAAKDLVALEGNLDEESAERLAGTLLTFIEEYVAIEQQVFAEGLESMSPSMQAELQESLEVLQLIASHIDVLAPNRTRSDASTIIDTFEVPDLGGTISVHGLKGSSISALQQTSGTVDGKGVITETGRALAMDFGSLTSPVLRASFTVTSSLPTDQVRVSFLRDSGVVEEQTVASGSLVTYEHASGITGVVIQNVTDILSEEAKAYLEYLRTYQSNYLYSWQDPGPQHHYFVTIRKDLYDRRGEIIAEANRGEGSHPVSVSDLSVTTDLAQTKEASPLSMETNALYAKLALPELTTFPFPYGGFNGVTQVSYDPNAYNVYSLKVFGGAPEIEGMTYVDASGQNRALPAEFYSINGNSITVFPTGQNLTIGVRVKNGTGYSPSLPVGQNYDYEVLTKSGTSMAEALPSPEARIGFDDIALMTVNEGPQVGWHSGASLWHDTASPVALGNLKAQAQITNTGEAAAGFTVKVYSGNTGVSGWDQMQYSYQGTLGGGQSRALVTPFSPVTDSQGRSFVRFVVVGDDGRILAEHGRTVGAPGGVMTEQDKRVQFLDFMKNWTTAMEHAQTETAAYFASLGETVPAMTSPAVMAEQIIASNADTSQMPDPAMTERSLRIAMRGLVSARESGDPERIALEQGRFDEAVAAHNAARSVVMATPGAGVAPSVADIMKREEADSTLHGAALAREDAGLMEGAYEVLGIVGNSAEGLGTMEERIREYAKAHNLSSEFLVKMLGVSIVHAGEIGLEKLVSPEGDLLTAMNRTSLLRIKQNAEQALVSASARGNTDQINFFTLQRDAATGLLGLIPEGSDKPFIGESAQALSWKALIERTTSDPEFLGKFAEARLSNISFQLKAGGREFYGFELTEEAMVNVTMPASNEFATGQFSETNLTKFELQANFSIQIKDEKGTVRAFSNRDAKSGDSLSLRLPKGKYSVVISDATSYPSISKMTAEQRASIQVPGSRFNFEAKVFNNANIEGVMSIDGNPQTMPVSMRVAEFLPSGERNDNYKGIDITKPALTKLDPRNPVWVVIHGMNSSENDGIMQELAKSLYGYHQSGIQVVTIDWNKAADPLVPTQDAPWAVGVGQWVARQLIKLGFPPEKINGAGWSHGAYGLFETGREIQRLTGKTMNTLVALDAANNIPLFSQYDHAQVNFAAVSSNSIGFDSSVIAGSNRLARTANVSIKINSNATGASIRHKLAVTGFTSMLNISRQHDGEFDDYFSLETLMGDAQSFKKKFTPDSYDGGYEGVLDVILTENDDDIFPTVPTLLRIRKPNASSETTIDWNKFYA